MSENDIIIYILLSLVIMLLFAFAVIWFLNQTQKKLITSKISEQELLLKFRKELLLNTVRTEENERNRISKELHDDVTSQLSIINLNIHLLKQKVTDNEDMFKIIDHIETSLKQSTERTRTISHELMPLMLKKFGLHHAVQELEDSVNITEIFHLDITNDHIIQINDDFKLLHIYRIIQELINNAIKYSKAKNVHISFEEKQDLNIKMTYTDDGVGFNSKKIKRGLGLSNMNARITLLDGTVKIDSILGSGTTITFIFPNHD
ncbi:MAG: histidine kinase [Saprospiraceae bacterium]|nr:histidine kinase [Saprospiraceae bacterium]